MNLSPVGSTAAVGAIVETRRSAAQAPDAPSPAAMPVVRRSPEPQSSVAERTRRAAEQIESFVRSQGRNLEFRVDDSTGLVVVRVRDAGTGEVIRQIPSETALRFAERIARDVPDDGAASVIFDEVV
jgi:flagellar protein FlaG